MTTEKIRVTLPDPSKPVVVNADGHGFYRVAYSPELLSRLNASTIRRLSIIERYNLVDDAWSAVVAGRTDAADFLRFISNFDAERDLAVWQAIALGLRGCSRLLSGDQQSPLQARIAALVAPALDDIGWDPTPNENDLRGKLRGLLIVLLACDASDPAAQERGRAIFAAAGAGTAIDPEILVAATSIVSSTGGDEEFDMFTERFKTATVPQDRMRALYALANFQSAALIARACEFAFSSEVKSQDAPFLLNRCMGNREYGHVAWRIIRERWAEANEKFPVNSIVRMVDPVRVLNTAELLAEAQEFFAEHPIAQSAKTLEQILERQRINTALRRREESRLFSALHSDKAP